MPDDPTQIHSQPLDWRIWGAYVHHYEDHSKKEIGRGLVPSHSYKNMRDSIRRVRLVLDPLRVKGTTDKDYFELLDNCLNRFFEQDDKVVDEADWNFALFATRLPKLVKQVAVERRAG